MASSIPNAFFARVLTEAAGFGIGGALREPIVPLLQELTNETWRLNPFVPLAPGDAAMIAGEDRSLEEFARGEAAQHGIKPEKFDHLIQATRTGPGVALALEMWRRRLIDPDDFDFALWKESLAERFHAPLAELHDALLSPADLAMMRQQGFVERPRQVEESGLQGITPERADLLFEISGLPPGIEPAVSALHRGFIDSDGFAQIVREGHTKTKYTDLLLKLAVPILSPVDAANLRLRGWIDATEAERIGALSGYTAEQMQRLYEMRGRPASPTQGYTAWARGAPGPYGGTFDRGDFDTLIRQSDIRPEYADTLWHNRFAYPSLFQLRNAVQSGGITPERARVILHYERYEDADAEGLVSSWTAGGSTATHELTKAEVVNEYEAGILDRAATVARLEGLGESATTAAALVTLADYRVVRSSLTAAMTKTRTLYVGWKIDRNGASNELDSLGIPATARDRALAVWDHERELNRPELTVAQIVKAAKHEVITAADALGRMLARGYVDADARVILHTEGVTI